MHRHRHLTFRVPHSAFGIALAALCAAGAFAAPKVLWEESVADADTALVLVGDVREGAALVVGPVTDQGQIESLAAEFGPNGVPVVGRDKNGRRTLGLGGCREWERPAFAPDGLRDATLTLLAASDIHAHNTFEDPDAVAPVRTAWEASPTLTLPRASVATLRADIGRTDARSR